VISYGIPPPRIFRKKILYARKI